MPGSQIWYVAAAINSGFSFPFRLREREPTRRNVIPGWKEEERENAVARRKVGKRLRGGAPSRNEKICAGSGWFFRRADSYVPPAQHERADANIFQLPVGSALFSLLTVSRSD